MEVILRDSDHMFNNQGQELVWPLMGYDEKEVMKNWWTALTKMDKFFKKNLKIEEAKHGLGRSPKRESSRLITFIRSSPNGWPTGPGS